MPDGCLPHLRVIAEALSELREKMVFVNDVVAGLLVSDSLADRVRATLDVDAVVRATSGHFRKIEEDVASRDFVRDIHSGVICCWVYRDSGVVTKTEAYKGRGAVTSLAGTPWRMYSISWMTARSCLPNRGLGTPRCGLGLLLLSVVCWRIGISPTCSPAS